MDFSNYPSEVREITDKILTQGVTEPQVCLELCQRLIQKGKKENDIKLLGFGYYHLSDVYFTLNDNKNFIECLQLGIEYQKAASQWSILAKSYNLMGVSATNQGNITVALDQYLLGLKVGKTHNCEYETAIIYNNLGQLYVYLEEFERAIHYLLESEQLLQKFQTNSHARENLIMLYTILGHCYLELGKISEAEEAEQKMIKRMQGEELESVDMLLIRSFQAQLRHAQGRSEECEQYVAMIMKSMGEVQTFLEAWEDILCFGEFLFRLKKYTELKQFFQKMEEMVEKTQITNLKIKFLCLKIRYYKEQRNRKEYLESCAKLYEYREIQDKENLAMLRRSAELKLSLEEARGKEKMLLKEAVILRERAERDALTGLPNRYRLKELAEELFRKAYQGQKNFGIEILDVDYFKQYNDGYGHQKGDECLKIIGEALEKMMEDDGDIFCTRYGGDEFVIVYYGKSDEEILRQAVLLRKRILDRRILHHYSPETNVITISQGIHNTVPKEEIGAWDYLHSADKALYQAKKYRKNSVCMKYEKENDLVDTVVLVSRRKNDI